MTDENALIDAALAGDEKALGKLLAGVQDRVFDLALRMLGTMFKMDSRAAADALGITPEAYRQRLSRARARMAEFLTTYCGVAGGPCRCARRVDYAIATHRIDPARPGFQALEELAEDAAEGRAAGAQPAAGAGARVPSAEARTDAMELLDDASGVFASLPRYRCPSDAAAFARSLVASDVFAQAVSE